MQISGFIPAPLLRSQTLTRLILPRHHLGWVDDLPFSTSSLRRSTLPLVSLPPPGKFSDRLSRSRLDESIDGTRGELVPYSSGTASGTFSHQVFPLSRLYHLCQSSSPRHWSSAVGSRHSISGMV